MAADATVTLALLQPPTERDEATLLARLPEWDTRWPAARYAFPLAPPSAGVPLAVQARRLDRIAAVVGAERLLAVMPPVGTAGWEASDNLGYLPFGGFASPAPLSLDDWLDAFALSSFAGWVWEFTATLRPPTAEEVAAQLDPLLAAAAATGRSVEVWLPAALLIEPAEPAWLAVVTGKRASGLRQVGWTGVRSAAAELERQRRAEHAAWARAAEAARRRRERVPPEPVWEFDGLDTVLARAAACPGSAAVDLSDHPLERPGTLDEVTDYRVRAAASGLDRLVLRVRLDTFWSPLWRELATVRP